jgi:hypothetical protein
MMKVPRHIRAATIIATLASLIRVESDLFASLLTVRATPITR